MSDTSFPDFSASTTMRDTRTDIASLPPLGLEDGERALFAEAQAAATRQRWAMEVTEAYYLGEQVIRNLRIAVPKELEFLRTVVGWPAIAVDPLVERLSVDGFRLLSATRADDALMDLWALNGLDSAQSLAFTDALSLGRSYLVVGSPEGADETPRITVESPLNMVALWDSTGMRCRVALQEFWRDGRKHAAMLLPRVTITLESDDSGQYTLVDRDEHGFDFVPVVRMVNRPRTHDRNGRSEITPAIMSITDAACRTLLGLEVAREFYSVPQRLILGASESDFQNADGTAKTAWETYITRVLALERDENGDLPTVTQFAVYDPSVFTKLIEMYASQMAGLLAAPPQDLGLYTQGNPTSAEAAQVGESRRDRRAVLRQKMFSGALVEAMQYGVRFQNKGALPEQYRRIAVDWQDVALESLSLASDGISKQVAAGVVPGDSDVVRKRLGWNAVERELLAQDTRRAGGRDIAQQIADSLNPQETPQETPSGGPAGQ